MRFNLRFFPHALFGVLLVLFAAPSSFATITYQISLAHPEQHLFHVSMMIPSVEGSVTVQMPAWNALYEIRDFASRVREVKASNESGPLPIEKLDKQTWRVTGKGTITIQYDTFWDEPGPFASQLNSEHAFFNPAMILMYIPARRAEDLHVDLTEIPNGWKVATTQLKADDEHSFAARNYDELADSPVEIGAFAVIRLENVPAAIRLIIHGKPERPEILKSKLERICDYELSLMGGAPFERYTFIFHVGENAGSGGMEHANATAIAGRTENMLLSLSAHEFFHLWNVKRVRPASLEPVDYTKEQYTKSLWFAEGVTSTYERYTLLRSGLWNKDMFYSALGRQIGDLESRAANAWQSAEQSSLDTWFEKYSVYLQGDHSVSYYTKGAMLGVLLDLWIREQTNDTRSLDDMMRALNEQFGKTGKPYRDREDLEAVCSQTANHSCKEFFDNYVSGTKPFPYDEYFSFAGWKIRRVVHASPQMGTQTAFEISEDDAASEKQKRIRAGILTGTTEKAVAAPN